MGLAGISGAITTAKDIDFDEEIEGDDGQPADDQRPACSFRESAELPAAHVVSIFL